MLADVGKQLIVPPEIISTSIELIIELTVPWEGAAEEANERKRFRYAEIAVDAQQKGWEALVRPVEIGCRGFVATIRW